VPQPPRMPELKRPLTGKQLDEIKARLPVMPDQYAASTMHIVIQKPVIRPDPAITHQMHLNRHQSEQSMKKQSSRVNVTYTQAGQENIPSTRASILGSNKIHVESERSSPHRDDNQENEQTRNQAHFGGSNKLNSGL